MGCTCVCNVKTHAKLSFAGVGVSERDAREVGRDGGDWNVPAAPGNGLTIWQTGDHQAGGGLRFFDQKSQIRILSHSINPIVEKVLQYVRGMTST